MMGCISWNTKGVILVTDDKYTVLLALILKGMKCLPNAKLSEEPLMQEYEDSLIIENPEEVYAFLRMQEPELYYPRLTQAINHRKYVDELLKDERSKEDGNKAD